MKRIDLAASVWALFAFAFSQPLLDLLGRNPGFFLARGATRAEVVLIAAVLMVILPGALAAAVALARSAPTPGLVIHGALFVTAAAILAIAVIDETIAVALPGWPKIGVGLALATAAWLLFMTWQPVTTAFRFAAVGPPIFLVLFLFFSPSSSLILQSDSGDGPAAVAVGQPGPVVVMLFDEFPLASIIDEQGEILDDVYPNLARLAEEGIWFRNAVSVEQQTEHSIPAILTGHHPEDRDALPTAGAYPANLFSLLGRAFDVRAVESVTEMCPMDVCSTGTRVTRPPLADWQSLALDLAVVSGHLLLPSDLTAALPPITQTWGGFVPDYDIVDRFNEHVADDRRLLVERFLDLLERPADEPTLYYAHLLVPHIPWTYLPTGQQYRSVSPAPGSTPTGWGTDEWLVMQAYQRHMIQVQYADTIVGQVIDALHRNGDYEDALIVVVSDHGTADVPGVGHRRVITEESVGHVAAVPLFVKLPGGQRSGVDDYRAETLDILPTIADVLDVSIPWQVEGTSLIGPDRPERTQSTMFGPKGNVTFGVQGNEKLAAAAEKMEWFPSGDPFSLVPSGHAGLLGMELSDLEIEEGALSATIDDPQAYRDLELGADPFPARLSGVVRRESGFEGDVVLAVSLNGRIEAVVRSYDTRNGMTRFQAMLPPEAFQAGSNDIELVLVAGQGNGSSLVRIELPGV